MKRGHIQILAEFIEGLNLAVDSAGVMIHLWGGNPKWMAVRDLLNQTRDGYLLALASKGTVRE